jgi:hypothetical protein
VVILTMLAAESFDPRLMWDAAAQPRILPQAATRSTPLPGAARIA